MVIENCRSLQKEREYLSFMDKNIFLDLIYDLKEGCIFLEASRHE